MNRAQRKDVPMRTHGEGSSASVIIPVWNGREYLTSCLTAVLSQDYPEAEIIAVDNASSDGSADLIESAFPEVHLIRNEHNLGFAGGCNVGLEAATGDVLVLLNQDTHVHRHWLRELCGTLKDPRIGVAGCKILYPDGKTIQHAGGWIDWPLGLAHHYGRGKRDEGNWDASRAVDYVTGAAMAFRRDVMERIGLLDEQFWPGYFEDIDYCFRAEEADYIVQYAADATLLHHETTSSQPSAVSEHYQRGRWRFLLKHVSPKRILNELVPAEEAYQETLAPPEERRALRMAYLETIAAASSIIASRWEADRWTVRDVLKALAHLHHLAWEEDTRKPERSLGPSQGLAPAEGELCLPDEPARSAERPVLEEFSFKSVIPVVGPLIAGFRALWYDIAARWAVRHLRQQLEAVSQRQEARILTLERLAVELSRENAILAREISNLTVGAFDSNSDPPRPRE